VLLIQATRSPPILAGPVMGTGGLDPLWDQDLCIQLICTENLMCTDSLPVWGVALAVSGPARPMPWRQLGDSGGAVDVLDEVGRDSTILRCGRASQAARL
jgi:hypothetical protein